MFFCARISIKMFHSYRISSTKLHIFSTISLGAIFFVIIFFSDAFIDHSSIHSTPFRDQKYPLNSIKEDVIEQIRVHEDHASLVPPVNVTVGERIEWFKKKLPEFGIFKSDELSRRFDGRVREFYGRKKCKVKFFMTWIAPANLFGRREILSLESVFKAHKDGCLVILSQSLDSEYGNRVLKPMVETGFQVLAVMPDLPFLFKKTPVKDWYNDLRTGKKDPGEIPLAQNLSNLIRLAVLYKYGGVYLDTDFIVMKDFSGLRNCIGAQSNDLSGKWSRLNNAVLVFDKGHPLLHKFMEEFAAKFDGNKWGHNGPYLVSRVVERVLSSGDSLNFTVLPPMAFYPADWTRISGLFKRPRDRKHGRWMEAKMVQLKGESYGVHLWNRESSRMRIEQGSIISSIFSHHCIFCKGIYDS